MKENNIIKVMRLVEEYNKEKTIIEIRNRLKIGDELEVIIPGKIESYKFTIEKLWDIDTDEEIEFVNPRKIRTKGKNPYTN